MSIACVQRLYMVPLSLTGSIPHRTRRAFRFPEPEALAE